MYNFLVLFYLLGAGTGAAYFLRLRLPFFFGAAPAPQCWLTISGVYKYLATAVGAASQCY